jgi:glycosyltransferase involved in cell wall biosynthesis
MTHIAVVIPVGPEEHHARYLDEALASVAEQTHPPCEVVIVDDMHGRDLNARVHEWEFETDLNVLIYEAPWRLGVGHAFNHGCAIAFDGGGEQFGANLALMLGADDRLEPRVLEHLAEAYVSRKQADGYYWFDTIYESGEEQGLPCNNAAVTRGFMRETGGLPIEASSGGMDAALISAMLVHRPNYLHRVRGPEGRFWSRQHEHQESRRLGAYYGAMGPIRDAFTRAWEPTRWGRYD